MDKDLLRTADFVDRQRLPLFFHKNWVIMSRAHRCRLINRACGLPEYRDVDPVNLPGETYHWGGIFIYHRRSYTKLCNLAYANPERLAKEN